MTRRGISASLLLLTACPALAAETQLPPEVSARIAALDAQCTAAGGKVSARTYVLVHDFTGDGRPDFLVSEGNYNCAGLPTLFRRDGTALVEVFESLGDGGARSVYRQSLLAYRLLDRTPVLIQVARRGPAACKGAAQCGYELQWNGRLLTEVAVGTAVPPTPAPPAAGPVNSPAATLVTAPLKPQTQAEALADCRTEYLRAGIEAKYVAASCADRWKTISDALPAARLLMKFAQAPAGTLRTVAQARAALTGPRWAARAARPQPPVTLQADGTLGNLGVTITGRGAIDTITFDWNETGALPPYDIAGALRFLGARLTPIACGKGGDAFGDGTTRLFRAEVTGAPPFKLETFERIAAIGSQSSTYTATADMTAQIPTLAGLRAATRSRDPIEATQWSAPSACPPTGI